MDNETPSMECEVCGGTDFYKETGHFYCNECQTQSQQVQDHVFEQEEGTVNKKGTKKIQKEKPQKADETLTSWECYNFVLKGLVEELLALGAKPELTVVVRNLWMKYLHKCEVFDINSDRPPKLSVLGPKKDVAILYNVKKRKRRLSGASSASTVYVNDRRQRSSKRRALIKSQYDDLSQSQTPTQDSSLMNDTLSSLKSGSEASGKSSKINYNKYSNKELKQLMSRNHREEHLKDVAGDMTCHKLRARSFRIGFIKGPTNLTTFTLYSLLYIGLLITGDPIQLGDMLRFIREGHLSFGCFKHFFDETMSDKALNLSQRKEKLFMPGFFRKRCAKLAQFLDVSSYIEKPDLIALSARYCAELNLPNELFECVEKLIVKCNPKMAFTRTCKAIPNYEGRALSFIVFALKLLFGLDGATEGKMSEYAARLNNCISANPSRKMFDVLEWLQFLGYRREILTLHHLPTTLRDCNSVNSDKYLSYLKNQEVRFKGSSRHIHGEVKDYLQVLDKLLEGLEQEDDLEMVFQPSLTPCLAYTKLILDCNEVPCANTLQGSFADHSLEFILRPNSYLTLLGTQRVKNSGANDNIVIEDLMYLYKSTVYAQKKSNKTVPVRISHDINEDKFVDEYLEAERIRKSLKTTDVKVFLSNWRKGNRKQFLVNKDQLNEASSQSASVVDLKILNADESYVEHYNAFERYWMNVPTNPVAHYFPKHEMDAISAKFPGSFKAVLSECTRLVEQDECDFFGEFLMTELYLVNFGEFGSKLSKGRWMFEIQPTLIHCKKHW